MSFLRSCSMGGTLMQTWRGLLDPDGSLYVQKADVQRACAQVRNAAVGVGNCQLHCSHLLTWFVAGYFDGPFWDLLIP